MDVGDIKYLTLDASSDQYSLTKDSSGKIYCRSEAFTPHK